MQPSWAKLNELPRQRGVRSAWGSFPKELLVLTSSIASSLPCDAGHACQRMIIEQGPQDAFALCGHTDAECERRQVMKAERAIYQLNSEALFDHLITALGARKFIKSVSSRPDVWSVGHIPVYGDTAVPLYFAFTPNPKSIDQAIAKLMLIEQKPFLLVVSNGKALSADHAERARAITSMFLSIDDLLAIDADGLIRETAIGTARVRDWINIVAPLPQTISAANRFKTPAGTKWADITITIMTRDTLRIKCTGLAERTYDRAQIPGMFKASSEMRTATRSWTLLNAFAQMGSSLDYQDLERALQRPEDRDGIKKNIGELRKILRHFFGMEDDPIPFVARSHAYELQFVVRHDQHARAEILGDEELVD